MEILDSLGSVLGNINYELIFQLVCLALIVLSGPVVIFLLAARGGDL
ncbi:MAG: photosystem II reaction center protein Ycf12 [Oscillatoriales cyanobacterium SM2_1_8]|nr:photosystem II reaction center protein Ycf12 [Oscillatoriales cyanobacterium SM2_1_8]